MLIKDCFKFCSILKEARGSEKYKINANANDIMRKCGEESLKLLKTTFFKNKMKKLGLEMPSSAYLSFGMLPIIMGETNSRKKILFRTQVPVRRRGKSNDEIIVTVIYDPKTEEYGSVSEDRNMIIILKPQDKDTSLQDIVERIRLTVVHETAHARDEDLFNAFKAKGNDEKEFYEASVDVGKIPHMIYLLDPYEILAYMTEAWKKHRLTKDDFDSCLRNILTKSFHSPDMAVLCVPFVLTYYYSFCKANKDYFNKFGAYIPKDRKTYPLETCKKMYERISKLDKLLYRLYGKKGNTEADYKIIKTLYYLGVFENFDYQKIDTIVEVSRNGLPDYIERIPIGNLRNGYWR